MSRTSSILPRMGLASRLIDMRQQPVVGRCQSLRSAFAIARQRRTYSVSLATDPSEADNSHAVDDVDDATMARHNLLSRRLYRTLLRSCQGVRNANKSNSISSMASLGRSGGDDAWMLLQPPMDQRQYGHAKIVHARRGKGKSLPNSEAMHNQAAGKMSNEEIGMAMEVLRFVHMSLGGDADDNLEDYYLGGSEHIDGSLDDLLGMNDGKKNVVQVVEEAISTAAAGRHSEGHYTDFIDEDEERGEGEVAGTIAKSKEEEVIGMEVEIPDEWDSDDEDDDMYRDLDVDESVLVSSADLANAVRIAFRAPLVPATQANGGTVPLSTIIAGRHRDAIGACSMLADQLRTWGGRSSVAIDAERGVRVAVTSALMKRPDSVSGNYRFCYRVRVENVWDAIDEHPEDTTDDGERADGESADATVERRAIQLLGRTWNIFDRGPWHKTSSSVLKRLLEEGVILPDNATSTEEEDEEENELRMVQTVDEPRTGAVGHLPVLGPGEVFEYMSGAEIATKTGAMGGAFHMASVDMQTTHSALVGNKVEALTWNPNDERRFQMPVNIFGFEADPHEK